MRGVLVVDTAAEFGLKCDDPASWPGDEVDLVVSVAGSKIMNLCFRNLCIDLREMCCPAMSRWHALSLPSTSESDGGMDASPATTEAWLN